MRRILFLQIKGNSLGGIWFVNKALGEEFLKRGYEVKVLGIRNNHPGMEDLNTPLEVTTINEKDAWEIVHKRDVLREIGHKKFFTTLKQYFIDKKKLTYDYKKMQEFVEEYSPDYIIASHYQTLAGVPAEYLRRVIYVQHSSFDYLLKDRNNIKVLKKNNDKIFRMCWLCESTMKRAVTFGFKKNDYIYNPNKFTTDLKADVLGNKKIVVITRIHSEKRIDLMVEMVNDVFKNSNFKDWTFDIYGTGVFNERTQKILKSSNQIFYKGVTDNPKDVLLNGSLVLNTSLFEGFSLSIIEGFSCGLPVISFDFGESAKEQIINNYNGYVIKQGDILDFKNKLKDLLTDKDKLQKFSFNAKEFSRKFNINIIANQWEEVFKQMEDLNGKG